MNWLVRFLVVFGIGCLAGVTARAEEFLVYFGTYTGKQSKGIYLSRFQTDTGKLSAPELAAETASPSFLAAHPNHGVLYAVGEVDNFGGKKAGVASAFSIDPASGKLTALNQQSSGGPGPCHLSVDATGKAVLVANYGGGSVAALPIRPNGSLGEHRTFIQHEGSSANKQRQEAPHGHCIVPDPANRFALACDLGLDKVLVYRLDPAGARLTLNEPPSAPLAPGSGPRHLAFLPDGRFVYVINEMLCTVTAFAYDAAKGSLKEVQTISTLPAGESLKPAYSTAEIVAHPSGKFIYGSNRGHDTIAVFAVDSATGKLKAIQHEPTQGKIPRNFNIDPTGRYLLAANQNSNSVVVFAIDPATGRLRATGEKIEVGAPVCVVFVPASVR
jgi:6-phosphogluconolactonase